MKLKLMAVAALVACTSSRRKRGCSFALATRHPKRYNGNMNRIMPNNVEIALCTDGNSNDGTILLQMDNRRIAKRITAK